MTPQPATRSQPPAGSCARSSTCRANSAGSFMPRTISSSVAEHGRVAARPLPQRRCADHLCVSQPLRIAEVARIEADRAQPQLSARLGELLPESLERRAVVTDDAL